MYVHGTGYVHGAQSIQGPHRTASTPDVKSTDASANFGADQVEFSREADFVSQVRELPDIRADRIADIRRQIEAGAYETEEKIDIALDRLLEEIDF